MSKKNTFLDNNAFLGRGWNFPPTLTEDGVQMVAYERDIEQSLHVLFSTSPGERVNRYDYGCPLRRYAFEPMDTDIVVRMRNDITRAVTLFKLTDPNKNEMTMDKDGITLSSAKDITLKAKGNIKLDATLKLSATAKQDASLEGLNVKVQAKVGATVKGNATAELSASGQTTVKGAMVMIN